MSRARCSPPAAPAREGNLRRAEARPPARASATLWQLSTREAPDRERHAVGAPCLALDRSPWIPARPADLRAVLCLAAPTAGQRSRPSEARAVAGKPSILLAPAPRSHPAPPPPPRHAPPPSPCRLRPAIGSAPVSRSVQRSARPAAGPTKHLAVSNSHAIVAKTLEAIPKPSDAL
jgi:hypothetical protein